MTKFEAAQAASNAFTLDNQIAELQAENVFLKSFLQMHSPQMNGQHSYRWRTGWPMNRFRGPDTDSAVKAAMAAQAEASAD